MPQTLFPGKHKPQTLFQTGKVKNF